MKKNIIILPRVFEGRSGKYDEHKGKPKLSYSQHTSWKDPEYKSDYIVQYFSGIKLPDGIWATFGGEVGTYIECRANKTEMPEFSMLSDEDKRFLDGLEYPSDCIYEDEICVDLGEFVVEGYTDRSEYIKTVSVGILDYKTGNLDKKKEFYESDEYAQTTLYCYQKVKEGFKIEYSRVALLGRKGNNMTTKNGFQPIRLSGEFSVIETPYSSERAETILSDLRKSAEEISELYKVYLKYFK
jgi:hypothetical protein